jgi:hypothetical protein
MRTYDARLNRQLQAQAQDGATPAELVPVDILNAVAGLQPSLDRLRRGEWRVLIMGPKDSRERDAASLFHVHLLDLADALEARR